MTTFQIDIIDPKAMQVLKNLEDKKLISISEVSDDSFMKVVKRIREKAAKSSPNLDEITKEVERVRSKRYARNRKG